MFLAHILIILSSLVTLPDHPRLMMDSGDEVAVKQSLGLTVDGGVVDDSQILYQYIKRVSDELLFEPPVAYTMSGFRLLPVSREALKRVFYLSFTYRVTGKRVYADRATKELLAVCAFPDWNPQHFLDVAEMSVAVAIGYDWLYDVLTSDEREVIANSLMDKALLPSCDERYNAFLGRVNNWNQVCNCGMTFAALAVYELAPEFCEGIVRRSMDSIITSMATYAPDGAYPEGYQYWGYGTTFNVMMIAALESAGYDCSHLIEQQGFMASSIYMLYMNGCSGLPFNYSDSVAEHVFYPVQFWFASRSALPVSYVSRVVSYCTLCEMSDEQSRFLPLSLIYFPSSGSVESEDGGSVGTEVGKMWSARGRQPMFMIRTDWRDNEGVYVAAKGGSPRTDHGHMDAGSFIFESNGVRWTEDLGTQSYEPLERANVSLWDSRQDGDRWKIYRYTNFAHNTITIDGQLHNAESYVPLVDTTYSSSCQGGVFDMTSLYPSQLSHASRSIYLFDDQCLEVTDSIIVSESYSSVGGVDYQGTIVTSADIEMNSDGSVTLSKDGESVRLTFSVIDLSSELDASSEVDFSSEVGGRLEVVDNEGPREFDEPNSTTQRLILHAYVERASVIKIKLLPL